MSLLECRAVKVVKSKKKMHLRKIENVKNRHTRRPYTEKQCWALKHDNNGAPFKVNEAALAAYESMIAPLPV